MVEHTGIINKISNKISEQSNRDNLMSFFGSKIYSEGKTSKNKGAMVDSLGSVNETNSVNMANLTYSDSIHGEDKDTVSDQLARENNVSELDHRNKMIMLASTTSPEDYKKMSEDGFSMEDATDREIVTETDKIKAVLAKAGVDISIYGDDLSTEQLQKITGSPELAQQIVTKLKENDLPVTVQNIEDVLKAYELSTQLGPLSDDAMVYVLKNNLEPSIENFYMAEHSLSSGGNAYQNDAGSIYDFMSEEELDKFQEQINQTIRKAGLTTSPENIENARWLVEQGISLNGKKLRYLKQMKVFSQNTNIEETSTKVNQKLNNKNHEKINNKNHEKINYKNYENINNLKSEDIINSAIRALSQGQSASKGMLIAGYSIVERAENANNVVNQTTDKHILYCVSNDMDVTIENLEKAQNIENLQTKENSPETESLQVKGNSLETGDGFFSLDINVEISVEENIRFITARRQVEEVRLSMTVEANIAMLKRGISIDTTPIENLINELKEQEAKYYKELLDENDIEASEENISVFQRTTNCVENLRFAPIYAINQKTSIESLQQLNDNAQKLSIEFKRANLSYETMMTTPNKDYGDDISKAFGNIDDILEELGLDITKNNERAVRILAYNKNAITSDNIAQIKSCDEEVQRAFSNLTPKVTLEMIREGINPLDMNIHELNEVATEIKQNIGEDRDRFSKFLWKLEKSNNITEEERSSFIGIYRLISQVEKTDGAVIGSLVNQGADITMRNLLSAVRSKRKSGMDYSVDDKFQGINSVSDKSRIDNQINAAFYQNCIEDIMDKLNPTLLQDQPQEQWEEYTPEQMRDMLDSLIDESTSPVQVENGSEGVSTSQASNSASQEIYKQEMEYATEKLNEFNQAVTTKEEVYSFLDKYDIKNTAGNLAAATRIFRNPGKAFRDLWDEKEGNLAGDVELLRSMKDQLFKKFGEAAKNPEEMAEAQETLAEVAEHAMDNMIIEKDDISTVDIKEMKLINNQFRLYTQMTKEECYMIPMETESGMTGVSLKIVRGKTDDEKGIVDVFLHGGADNEGQIQASFQVNEKEIIGTIISSNQETLKKVEEKRDDIIRVLRETDINTVNTDGTATGNSSEKISVSLRVACIPDISSEKFHQSVVKREKTTRTDSRNARIQTKMLYGVSEKFIKCLSNIVK